MTAPTTDPMKAFRVNTLWVEADILVNGVPLMADVFSAGQAAVPALGAGASSSVISVEIKPGFSDATYKPIALVFGALSVLGALQVVSAVVLDATHAGVVVKNTGLVSLGGTVLVLATR
jgi:hypothetical protein